MRPMEAMLPFLRESFGNQGTPQLAGSIRTLHQLLVLIDPDITTVMLIEQRDTTSSKNLETVFRLWKAMEWTATIKQYCQIKKLLPSESCQPDLRIFRPQQDYA